MNRKKTNVNGRKRRVVLTKTCSNKNIVPRATITSNASVLLVWKKITVSELFLSALYVFCGNKIRRLLLRFVLNNDNIFYTKPYYHCNFDTFPWITASSIAKIVINCSPKTSHFLSYLVDWLVAMISKSKVTVVSFRSKWNRSEDCEWPAGQIARRANYRVRNHLLPSTKLWGLQQKNWMPEWDFRFGYTSRKWLSLFILLLLVLFFWRKASAVATKNNDYLKFSVFVCMFILYNSEPEVAMTSSIWWLTLRTIHLYKLSKYRCWETSGLFNKVNDWFEHVGIIQTFSHRRREEHSVAACVYLKD